MIKYLLIFVSVFYYQISFSCTDMATRDTTITQALQSCNGCFNSGGSQVCLTLSNQFIPQNGYTTVQLLCTQTIMVM